MIIINEMMRNYDNKINDVMNSGAVSKVRKQNNDKKKNDRKRKK